MRPLLADVFLGTNSTNTIAAQFWVAPQLWLKGGLGFGRYVVSDQIDPSISVDTAFAMTGALGYDLIQSQNFALDLSLRLASAFYDDAAVTNGSLMVGFHWY